MTENFKWGGHLPIVIVLLTMMTPKLFQLPQIMYQMGGFAIIIVAAPLLFLAAPIVNLQVILGQYAKLGPFGLWRAYPMGRGIGIAWLILSFMSICQTVAELSLIFNYIGSCLSTKDFPWMKCGQSWNSEHCRLMFPNSTQEMTSEINYTMYENSADEYYNANIALNTSSIISILLYWILVSTPLIFGPKSLIKCIFGGFVIVHGLNAVLFILAAVLPGAGSGLAFFFFPAFRSLGNGNIMFFFSIFTGFWFLPQFGSLIFLGKHAEPATFSYPHILISILIFFVMAVFNALKTGFFLGSYATLSGDDPHNFFYPWYGWFTAIPSLLSQTSGANFWLLLHFISLLLSWSVPLSLALEVVASSFAEILPGLLRDRTKFPGSTVLPFILTAVGFPLSILLMYLKTFENGFHFAFNLYGVHDHLYVVFFYFTAFAIAPISFSKVANVGREDILMFVSRQGSQSLASMRRIIASMGLCLTALAAHLWFLMIIYLFKNGYPIIDIRLWISDSASAIFVGILLGVAVLLGIVGAIAQCIMHCVEPSRRPCCSSLGESLEPEEVRCLEKPNALELSKI